MEDAAKTDRRSILRPLVAATSRLHGTQQRDDALSAVRDIVVNLVGSEELAVFELDATGATLTLAGSLGVDRRALRTIQVGRGIIGGVAQTGVPYVAGRSRSADDTSHERRLTACIPLKVHGGVIGVLAIFGRLFQKPELTASDEELLALLATQAATALYCSGLQLRLAAALGAPSPAGG